MSPSVKRKQFCECLYELIWKLETIIVSNMKYSTVRELVSVMAGVYFSQTSVFLAAVLNFRVSVSMGSRPQGES